MIKKTFLFVMVILKEFRKTIRKIYQAQTFTEVVKIYAD